MTTERINSPAPLPEDPETVLLNEMLVPAPYEVPVKKAKKKATGTRKGLRRKVILDSSSENTKAHSSHENEEEEEESSPPSRGRQEKEGRPNRGGEGSKKGRTLLPDCSITVAEDEDEWLLRAKPLAKL